MNQNIKLFISAGCSCSSVPYFDGHHSWPKFLYENYFNHCLATHVYKMGCGNGLISKSLLVQLNQALKTYKPEEIFVAVMWSSTDRLEVFCKTVTDLNYNSIESGPGYQNPQNIKTFQEHFPIDGNEEDRFYYMINPSFANDDFSKIYYKNFYDELGSKIQTLEHILRIQWFLENKHINYVFMSMDNSVLINAEEQEIFDVSYLNDLLDKTNYIKKDLMSFCLESGLPMHYIDNIHPSGTQQIMFTEKYIIPHLIQKGILNEN